MIVPKLAHGEPSNAPASALGALSSVSLQGLSSPDLTLEPISNTNNYQNVLLFSRDVT